MSNMISILDFISGRNKCFVIPPFQRNYEWTDEQCEELLKDVQDLQAARKQNQGTTHYLGNLIYYLSQNESASYQEFVLLDGQQRLTTVLLILCAVRDLINCSDDIDTINFDYLANKKGSDFRIRLKQTAYDNRDFEEVVNKTISKAGGTCVSKNYFYIKNWLSSKCTDVMGFYNALNGLVVVEVKLDVGRDLRAIQTIFEKINSTGKPLTTADLVRNHLLIADTTKEQDHLYKSYWVKIEETIKNENVDDFLKVYLTMKLKNNIDKHKTYRAFKEYASELESEEVLHDLLEYSEYFKYILFLGSKNEQLDRLVQMIKDLEVTGALPCLLYLFKSLYDNDCGLLVKILGLLKGYLVRYRIVLPSSGGRALQDVLLGLVGKFEAKTLEITYENVYFELSNSDTAAGHYPTDDEFKHALSQSNVRNYKYARVVLLSIEESEMHNIPVPFDKVTIEHLLPQELSDWWKDNLGGEEHYQETYNKYINAIGNLAPISQSYNSKNSNLPWSNKRENLQEVQFSLAREVAKYSKWTESEIKKRNKDICDRACKVILPPQKRTRAYKNLLITPSGVYPAEDIKTKMENMSICAFYENDNRVEVSTWREYFNSLCNLLLQKNSEKFYQVVDKNLVHKKISKRAKSGNDPLITKNKSELKDPMQIGNSEYYSEGCLSSAYVRKYAKDLLTCFDALNDFKIEVKQEQGEGVLFDE